VSGRSPHTDGTVEVIANGAVVREIDIDGQAGSLSRDEQRGQPLCDGCRLARILK
jgi:hypothetical protein